MFFAVASSLSKMRLNAVRLIHAKRHRLLAYRLQSSES